MIFPSGSMCWARCPLRFDSTDLPERHTCFPTLHGQSREWRVLAQNSPASARWVQSGIGELLDKAKRREPLCIDLLAAGRELTLERIHPRRASCTAALQFRVEDPLNGVSPGKPSLVDFEHGA